MAGVKGRSGRKSLKEEWNDTQLLQMCTSWLVRHFNEFNNEDKLKVALAIAPKGIVAKVEVSGEIDIYTMLKKFDMQDLVDVRNRLLESTNVISTN